MGLIRKQSTKEWADLVDRTIPDAKMKDATGRKLQYWSPGNVHPDDYLFPHDWDVLGRLSPNGKQKGISGLALTPK